MKACCIAGSWLLLLLWCGTAHLAADALQQAQHVQPLPVVGARLLRAAAMRRDATSLAELLRQGGADVDDGDANGATALYWATWTGESEAVRLLLEAGAAPGKADTDGFTPLMVAAYYGHRGVVVQLLAAGAESGPRDSVGRTALDWAQEQRQPQSMLLRLKLDDAPAVPPSP